MISKIRTTVMLMLAAVPAVWAGSWPTFGGDAQRSGWAKDETQISPESVKQFRFDPRTSRDTTPRQRAVYRGTICLVLRDAPRDSTMALGSRAN